MGKKTRNYYGVGLMPKDGTPGAAGPMAYPAGVYNPVTDYIRTQKQAPFVMGSDKNYYLLEKFGITTGVDPVTDNSEVWSKFDQIQYVFAEIILSNFANLAGGIHYNNQLMSQMGVKNGQLNSNYEEYSGPTGAWQPNILLDWLTGFISAGGGKFISNPDGSGHLAGGNIKWNVGGSAEFLGGVKSPFTDISNATIESFWQDTITSWANNFFENQVTTSLTIRIIPCRNLLNGQIFRIHALRRGIILQPEEYNGFFDNGTLLDEITLNKGDAIEMVCICFNDVFHSWDIIRRYKCRPYDQ